MIRRAPCGALSLAPDVTRAGRWPAGRHGEAAERDGRRPVAVRAGPRRHQPATEPALNDTGIAVYAAYAIIVNFNDERAAAPPEVVKPESPAPAPHAVSASSAAELLERESEVAAVETLLNSLPSSAVRLPRRWRIAGRVILGATALLIAGAVVDAAFFVQRDNVNSTTVAAALQSRLGDDVVVDCNPAGDEWSCTEHHLSEPRAACQIGTASAPVRVVTESYALVSAARLAQCAELSSTQLTASTESGSLVAIGKSERDAHGEVIKTGKPTDSLIDLLWKALTR